MDYTSPFLFSHASSVRRSSVYTASVPTIGNNNHLQNTTMRRQSTMPGGTMGPGGVAATPGAHRFAPSSRLMKDPRPVKDRAFQKKCRDDITQFLEARGYTQAFSERTLINPTTKDFQEIFRFIHNAYEGRITNNLNLAKKFEDEVPQLLRAAGYPFAADITKSHLQAIGAQHSWPGMLAMLHWFVQVINVSSLCLIMLRRGAGLSCVEVPCSDNIIGLLNRLASKLSSLTRTSTSTLRNSTHRKQCPASSIGQRCGRSTCPPHIPSSWPRRTTTSKRRSESSSTGTRRQERPRGPKSCRQRRNWSG